MFFSDTFTRLITARQLNLRNTMAHAGWLAGLFSVSLLSACSGGANVESLSAVPSSLTSLNNSGQGSGNNSANNSLSNTTSNGSDLFKSYDGTVVEFTANRDGTFDIYVRGLDRELTRFLIDANANTLLEEPHWGRLHDNEGTRAPDYLYVLKNRNNPEARSNCRITAYRHGTSEIYWTVAMPTHVHQCSMESVDSEQNYYFARDDKLVSLTPEGYLRFEVDQPLSPGGGKLMQLAGAMVLVEMASTAQPMLWVYSQTNGAMLYSTPYLGSDRPFETIAHIFPGTNDTFYAVGDNASGDTRELQRISAFTAGAQASRQFSRLADPGIDDAILMNNEIVAWKNNIVTILDSNTLETINAIGTEGKLLSVTDQAVYTLKIGIETGFERSTVHRYSR